MAELILLEAATLYLGTADPTKSKDLQLQNLTLPGFEYVTVEHQPGGAPMGVAWNMRQIKPLQPKAKLLGFDADSYAAIALASARVETFTARGSLRKKSTGEEVDVVAKWKGSLGSLTPDEFAASKELGHDHGWSDVTYYRVVVGGREWVLFDFFERLVRRNGVDLWRQTRTNLGLE